MPAWCAPQNSSSCDRSELEGQSVRKDATIMACIKEVCGNVFASAVYDKR